MKKTLIIILACFSIFSCKENPSKEEKISFKDLKLETTNQTNQSKLEQSISEEKEKVTKIDCEKYFEMKFPNDSIKSSIIDEVLQNNKLSESNINFLQSLKNKRDYKKLEIKNSLSPIFRISKDEIGIFGRPYYGESSEEEILIKKFDTLKTQNGYNNEKIVTNYLPNALESIKNEIPELYYYTDKKSDKLDLKELGYFKGECLDFYEYTFDTSNITLEDKVLFSSKHKLDLVYENNSKIDSLIENKVKKECWDCPSSDYLMKTFAKIKGTDNLYFAYADTFPINNELDMPSRALIIVNKDESIYYLWHDGIDLFGCSCL
ncbi:hypothetical protein [Aureivirga marina]|uniref:hypothetical protein n=1 Tax=Aureivirga marina TaxID=1182451 RepID=UPI0018C955B1|nr:hypothetical protein [Aureivirga marina]